MLLTSDNETTVIVKMLYFLGIDAGGTKTVGALANEERELARAQSGTIKLMRTGEEIARKNLASLLTQLAATTGVGLSSITRTCIGMAGFSVPLVTNWVRATVPQLIGGALLVCGDEEIALDAAFHGGPGVLVIAGTGSNVVGRTHDGRLAHAGGWGPALADEGSGHWIGHEGLRSAFRAMNEGQGTELFESIIAHWKLGGLGELIEKANAIPAPDFSQLVPVIVACAERGDAVGLDLLRRAGEELAHLTLVVIRRLREIGETSLPRVAFTGGVLHHVAAVRVAMVDALRRAEPAIEVLSEAVDPVQGALWRARQEHPAS